MWERLYERGYAVGCGLPGHVRSNGFPFRPLFFSLPQQETRPSASPKNKNPNSLLFSDFKTRLSED